LRRRETPEENLHGAERFRVDIRTELQEQGAVSIGGYARETFHGLEAFLLAAYPV
jgi:hypothetical protein